MIWNDIAQDWEAEFLNWHVREHMPERVGLPGFLRGQRYLAVEGTPRYFNFYEATDAAAFSSDAYRARLNDPTPWTRRVVAHFANTGRTICKRVAHAGQGDGAFVQTLRLSAAPEKGVLAELIKKDGIVAATLLQGIPAASGSSSAEKTLRSQPDEITHWVLLVEAVASEFLLHSAYNSYLDTALPGAQRGVYQLQFALSRQ